MKRMRGWLLAVAMALTGMAGPVMASPSPDEIMEDPVLEARAQDLYTLLRCVVCQSQSLVHSNATLAADMRAVVRDRLLAGDSDEEILDFMQERYGDYVLLRPPLQGNTLFLWLTPFLLLGGGGVIAAIYLRRQSVRLDECLDADDEARVQALMEEEGRE